MWTRRWPSCSPGGVEPESEIARLIEVGINHEQQHQELLLTDILALFAANPLRPAYRTRRPRAGGAASPVSPAGSTFPAASARPATTATGFAWDNEAPRHDVLIHPFRLADRLVTNGEWLEFMADGGYRTASLWLADGWATVNREGWEAPLYWEQRDGQWLAHVARRPAAVERAAPVAHVSYYEADAFARWAGKRLPTEFEWEVAAQDVPVTGNTLATRALRPLPAEPRVGRQAAPDVRRRVGMDAERLPALSGLPAARRRARRVQRQVHGEPAGAARRLLRHARRATRARPTATSSTPTSAGSSWACVSRRRSPDVEPESCAGGQSSCPPMRTILPPPSSTACRGRSKTLPCRFFYDARGSELFEEITRLPEYYPTRTEAAILEAHAAEMADGVPDGGVLVEFGSGSSLKTEILLRQLPRLGAYVSIDVSDSALKDATARLAARFPTLDVRPIVGDFSYPVALPPDLAGRHKTGFFPGSTIGNLTPAEAGRLLRVFRRVLSPGGRLIVGVDLKKDARRLVLAYNDAAGVTAAFNLNLLARINRELGGNFDLDAFRHEAIYNPREGRIEMHLESMRDQEVTVRRPPLPLPARRAHPHRELLQVLDRPVPGAGALGRLAAAPRVDRRGQSVQRARADLALTCRAGCCGRLVDRAHAKAGHARTTRRSHSRMSPSASVTARRRSTASP